MIALPAIDYALFRTIVYTIGLPIIAFLIWRIGRRLRAIKELDARLREEEAHTVSNPYAEMAKLYETQELLGKRLIEKPKDDK